MNLFAAHFRSLLFFGLSLGLFACGGDACQQLNSQIKDALDDGRITATESAGLLAFVQDPGNELSKKCSNLRIANGQPDRAALLAFIQKNPTYWKTTQKTGQPPVVEGLTAETSKPLRAKLYLEASASMFPYDASNGQGQFKQAITDLLTPFENSQPGQTKLAVVNDKVYDLEMSFTDFIAQPNSYAPTVRKGNPSYTDFDLIFRQILTDLADDEVAVVASDLIYSPKNGAGVNPEKMMGMGERLMTNVFAGPANKTALLVVQLSSDYTGKYYSETAHRFVVSPGQRPYYLCLMARNATMTRLLADPSRYDILHLPGFQNFWLFSNATAQPQPLYTVLLNDAAKKGTLQQATAELKTRAKTIHALEGVGADKLTKTLVIPVAVDLSALNLPEATKTDPGQYEVIGPDGFKVTKITAYGQTEGKPAGPQQTTHKLLLTSTNPARNDRKITIGLRRTFPPQWIADSHTNNDTQPDTQTTFGLQNLLTGIERAYNPTNQPTYFKLTITLAE
jgi:hypothetical protein